LSDDEEKRPLRRVLRRHDDDQDDTPEPRQPRRLRRRTTKTASSIPWKWIAGGAGLVVAFILLALFLNEMRTSEITLTPRGVIAVLVLFVSGVLAVIRFLNGEEVD
jgi:type VI protein secretion system component VasF